MADFKTTGFVPKTTEAQPARANQVANVKLIEDSIPDRENPDKSSFGCQSLPKAPSLEGTPHKTTGFFGIDLRKARFACQPVCIVDSSKVRLAKHLEFSNQVESRYALVQGPLDVNGNAYQEFRIQTNPTDRPEFQHKDLVLPGETVIAAGYFSIGENGQIALNGASGGFPSEPEQIAQAVDHLNHLGFVAELAKD